MKFYIKLSFLLLTINAYAQTSVPFDTIYVQSITATKAQLHLQE